MKALTSESSSPGDLFPELNWLIFAPNMGCRRISGIKSERVSIRESFNTERKTERER